MLRLKSLGGLSVKTDRGPPTGAATQRRRLALLALLAVARDRGVSRDRLLAYLWPESNADRARHGLAQSLYALRRDLHEDALFDGTTELRLNSAVMTSDVAEFEDALDRGDEESAVALYTGPFLDGFHLGDAPEFERWAEGERARLAQRYATALERLAELATSHGDHRAAAGWWRRLAAVDPLSSRVALRLMEVLAAVGDRAGAVQHARIYEALVQQELEGPADAAVLALAERLRSEVGAQSPALSEPTAAVATAATVPAPGAVAPPTAAPPSAETSSATFDVAGSPAVPTDGDPPTTYRRDTPVRLMRTEDFRAPAPTDLDAPSESGEGALGDLSAAPEPSPEPRRAVPPFLATGRWRWATIGVAVAAAIATAALVVRARHVPVASAPVIAVGLIHDYPGADSIGGALAIGDMLATNLVRIPGLQVVSTARIYELMGQLGSGSPPGGPASAAAIANAARKAGVTELVEGALYRRPGGAVRLDLRRVALPSGAVRQAYRVEGADPYALVDRATAELAADFSARGDTLHVADVTTASLAAYRLYEQGLRTMYQQSDVEGGHRLLVAALKEDSTFAIAAHYAFVTAVTLSRAAEAESLGAQAVRMADRATDRERLLILSMWNLRFDEPASLAYAETLVVRYPTEPDGHFMLGSALTLAGDFLGAIPHLRRVVAMDSLGLRSASPRCRACDATNEIIRAYELADSFPAAERTAREFVRLQPGVAGAHYLLGDVLHYVGREAEAQAEFRLSDKLTPQRPADVVERTARMAIRRGDLARADSQLAALLHDGDPGLQALGFWWYSISLRNQGRLRDALAAAQGMTAAVLRSDTTVRPRVRARGLEWQVLFELGRYREAAALTDSLRAYPQYPLWHRAKWARQEIWWLTHLATVYAAAGDTARLEPIADTIEMLGPRSLYGRDRRLQHHVRGLLWLARGRPAEAAAAFRRSIYSLPMGYSRTNLELGRLLLADRRPREAVAVVAPALRGALDASGMYATHTELHELLAQAYDAAGEPDSAAAHYRWVVTAWRAADPQFRPRWEAARARLAALDRPRAASIR